MPPSIHPPRQAEQGHRISEKYVLGNAIGRGAFGTVYECQNQETGEIVAVKRVALRNLSPEQLKGLEQEVEVLKMLHHPNIVKYIATVRTRNHLHIVLQFMENGSLTQNLKKFGVFSPVLVALFTRQVLQGLAYLHDQGVIHRDIKGANILSDKSGRVKLADFGVALITRAGGTVNGDQVVGTPYWMAPEIIEMLAPTSACDIWSVGCTVLELLTSKPPYFDVPAMTALYRIVSDETVPLPDNLPPLVIDFLKRCFIKQPSLRPSAHELLQHEWIQSSRGPGTSVASDPRSPNAGGVSSGGREGLSSQDEENPLQGVNPANIPPSAATAFLPQSRPKNPSTTSAQSQPGRGSVSSHGSQPVAKHRHSLPGQVYDTITADHEPTAASQQQNSMWRNSDRGSWRNSITPGLSAVGEHDAEDWDREFGFNNDPNSHQVLWTGPAQRVQKEEMTRPRSMRGMEQLAQQRAVQGSPAVYTVEQKARSSSLLLSPAAKSVQLEPENEIDDAFKGDREVGTLGSPRAGGGSAAARKKKGMRLAKFRESADDADFGNIGVNDVRKTLPDPPTFKQTEAKDEPHTAEFSASDSALDNEVGRSVKAQKAVEVQELVSRLKIQNIGTNTVVEASGKLVTMFREAPALKRTLLTHHGATPLLETLSKAEGEDCRAILRLLIEVADNDRSFQELLTMAGIVPVLTRLVGKDSPLETRRLAANLISHFLCTSPVALHMFVACGGLSTIVALLDSKGDSPPVIELAVVAVDGVQRVFAETVAPPGSHRRASMARAAAAAEARGNGIGGVPKNDFCLLFAKTLLLERLAALGHRLQQEEGKKESLARGVAPVGVLAEVCHIFSVFSLGGPAAKKHLADCSKALRFMLTTIVTRWAAVAGANEAVWEDDVDDDVDTVRVLLSCIKNLACETTCLDALDSAGVVQALVPFLSVRTLPADGDASVNKRLLKRRAIPTVATAVSEVHNLAMMILFYMLRLSPARQERAAVCGIIPYAKSAVLDKTTVKTFAMQILVDMAHSSDFTRHCLFKEGILDFFLETLVAPDPFWQERALQAIEQFLVPASHPPVLGAAGSLGGATSGNATTSQPAVSANSALNSEIERALLRPYALRRFVELFQSARSEYFESIVKTLMSMLECSNKLAEAIGRSGLFVSEITTRLSYPKAEVRINLLKLLGLISKRHPDLECLLLEHNLPAIVSGVNRSAKASKLVIVATYAEQLLASWKPTLDKIGWGS